MSGLYQRRRKRPELNLVPLIDVLVMLVFFAFVTMQFRSSATLNITLPKVETAGKNEFKGPVTIGISKDAGLSFNGQATTEAQLADLLRQVRELDKDTPVLIRADETTPLKTLTFVMDTCRKSGLNRFSLQSR
ncbi:MAG: biopolymer transporter ExbD [Opitutus sp.]|nr:biopolymer transporter ExbD [Opitutus sp.]MCS6247312.1 biopolymer transporter ExbD [Opitutus sp.]MCS6273773.1 biopolymer transporter ExbD [Opitutus sp.]MCS6278282.1 biopolymer transporter ExbD [Opitutus sp.]MCS6299392.1 biopolymer transporter ExbD [Opitutus sp.]